MLTLYYQDFKDTFVCNTQPVLRYIDVILCCIIRISKILLYAIHNPRCEYVNPYCVVLSGFQRYFCMQYTTRVKEAENAALLYYQDFKDTFVCNTQLTQQTAHLLLSCIIRISKILLYAIHNMRIQW